MQNSDKIKSAFGEAHSSYRAEGMDWTGTRLEGSMTWRVTLGDMIRVLSEGKEWSNEESASLAADLEMS